MSAPITIVDCGISNTGSIQNMLRRVGVTAQVTDSPAGVLGAAKLILPGVGSFDHGMRRLRELGLEAPLTQRVKRDGVPILGICLGMQLMTCSSEEGIEPGLGWLDAVTERFQLEDLSPRPKVPHMGWNVVHAVSAGRGLDSITTDSRYYFVHSYRVRCLDRGLVAGTTTHGRDFDSVVHRDNLYGVQFHPEKSHRFGMALLREFSLL